MQLWCYDVVSVAGIRGKLAQERPHLYMAWWAAHGPGGLAALAGNHRTLAETRLQRTGEPALESIKDAKRHNTRLVLGQAYEHRL